MLHAAIDPAEDAAASPGLRESGSGIVLAGDRSREFRRARRHSLVVSALRIAMPLFAAGLFGLYVWTIFETAGYGSATVAPPLPANIKDELKMSHPKYDGYTKDGGTYTVNAEWAIPDLANPAQVKLETITGVMFDAKKARTDMKAAAGVFDSKANKLDLSGGIDVTTESGMRARMEVATLMTKEGTILAQQTDTPVVIDMPTGQVSAFRMLLQQKARTVTFTDRVKTHLLPQSKPAGQAEAGAAPLSTPASPAAFGHSNAPVDIVCEQLDVLDDSKVAMFKRNVHAVQSGASLETDQLNVTYEGKAGAAALAAPPAAVGDPQQATRIKHIEAPGPVVLTQPSGERLTGNRADFEAADEIAIVTGNVLMTAEQDRRATADRVEFRQKADTFLLTGNVVVTQARNELRGRKLAVDRKAGRTEMTSPAENGLARSRIFARLYQGDGKPGQPGKAAKAADGADAAGPAGLMQFKTDPNAPVDVEADRLLAEDAKKTATFTGDVKAAQGEFVIRTVELIATHSGDAGLASLGTAQPSSGAAKAPTQLTRLDARGRVVITSKAGQEVTGDAAVFDMKANVGVVTGKEVILTQDKQVVRCNKLKIDMTTGLGDCLWEGGQAAATEPAPGGVLGARPVRPSAVFYPDQKPKSAQPKSSPAQLNPASSSWEASTAPTPN